MPALYLGTCRHRAVLSARGVDTTISHKESKFVRMRIVIIASSIAMARLDNYPCTGSRDQTRTRLPDDTNPHGVYIDYRFGYEAQQCAEHLKYHGIRVCEAIAFDPP